MVQLTLEELIQLLKEHNSRLSATDIEKFEAFLKEKSLEQPYINAVNKSFSSLGDVDVQVLELEIENVGRECLFSCMVDWALNNDHNWSEIHKLWQSIN